MKKVFLLGSALLFALIFSSIAFADGNLTDCGQVADSSGLWLVQNNITATVGGDACIAVVADDVTIDCQGYTIDNSYIIYNSIYIFDPAQRLTVNNCTIRNVDGTGITLENGNGAVITNNVIRNSVAGVGVTIGSNALIENNTFMRIFGNDLSFYLYAGENFTVRNNDFHGGGGSQSDVYFWDSIVTAGNLFYNNIFNDGNDSIYLGGTTNSWNVTNQSGYGIMQGSRIGGNFWGKCADADCDGFCDSPMYLDGNNIDYLPLSLCPTGFPIPPIPPTPPVPECNTTEAIQAVLQADVDETILSTKMTGAGIAFAQGQSGVTSTCIDNQTLLTSLTKVRCVNSVCNTISTNSTEVCQYGCDAESVPNSCKPSPAQTNIWLAIIFIVMIVVAIFLLRKGLKRI